MKKRVNLYSFSPIILFLSGGFIKIDFRFFVSFYELFYKFKIKY